jgi:hypothetical protein
LKEYFKFDFILCLFNPSPFPQKEPFLTSTNKIMSDRKAEVANSEETEETVEIKSAAPAEQNVSIVKVSVRRSQMM